MRLLTHNFLQSTVKGTENGYPLSIEPIEVRVEPSPMDRILLTKMLTKINYPALLGAVQDLTPHMSNDTTSEAKKETASSACTSLPQLPPQLDLPVTDESLLQALQLVLFDVHVVEGFLVCPDSKRKFPIKEGIPNMLLHEDEI